MKRALALTASLAALLVAAPALALAPAAPAAQTQAKAPAGAIAPIEYTQRTLPNGLRVFAIRDTSTPNVSVQVWYDVGSKDDPAGRSGFAHLFEHLMFKQTRNLANEQFDRLTEDVGGFNNASTYDDFTNYYEVVPANHLQRILWAEAERMGNLVVDEAVFKSERDVVKEELRQRILAQPYGKLFGLMYPEISFDTSPYGRPGIGSIENLDAATVEDVRAFHATYYRPDNAVLLVAGNFDPAELDKWVDQYFGPLKKPDAPLPRVTALEGPRKGPKLWTAYEPNTPLPAVVISYPFPAGDSPDMPALIVADAIMSKGESSRLYQSLVYDQQIATEAFTALEQRQQPGSYAVGSIMAEGKTAEAGEAALRAQVAKLRDAPVTAAELSEAKNQLVTDALRERETVDGKADALGRAVLISGDPAAANRLLGQIQAVTAADVQRVAKKYLQDETRAVILYNSDAAKPADAKPVPGTAPTVVAKALVPPKNIEIIKPAPEGERVAPPKPGADVKINLPAPSERTLANGLRVVVSQDHDLPLVSADLVIGSGGAADPAGRPGVASMSATLLTKGTKTRSATQIAQAVESLGGELGADASYDGSSVGLSVKSDQLEPGLGIFADVARNPVFAPDELERERQQALNNLQVALSDPATLASYAAARAVFGDAPYGRIMTGTETSLKAMGRDDVSGFHQTWFRPDNATLVLAGDLTPEQGFALAQKLFGDWKAPAAAMPAVASPAGQPKPPRVILIDLPEAGQAAVAVARRGIKRKDERYYPAAVANNVLGGGYSAWLNQEIRIKRGLSYGARSTLSGRRDVGPIVASAQTKNESADQVVDLIAAQMTRLGAASVGADELKARQSVLVGGFGRTLETTDGQAGLLGGLALLQIDLSELGRYVDKVQAVNADQVKTVGGELFDPAPASIVVVGDAKKIPPALKAKYPQMEVIPVGELDLDSPTLRKAK
ncbi:pitrilysin family protein [Caulobacter sp. 17J65-9]|uniref:M16 family metallopeptidase n=1 Tax=Caulobacter sp. 17J65-9 TaxID=2709382 RepID=UPI001969D1F7|nr:pitrilysin family protein [Caulobacter sp. 17J65-9]